MSRSVRNQRGSRSTARLGWTEIRGQDVRSPWGEINDQHARAIKNMEKVGGYWKTEPGIEEVANLAVPTGVVDGYDMTNHRRYATCFWGDWFISLCATAANEAVILAQKDGTNKVCRADATPSTVYKIATGLAGGTDTDYLLQSELFPLNDRVLIRFGRVNSRVDAYAQLGADGNWRWWPINWDAPKLWKYTWTGSGGTFEEWGFAFELVRKDTLGVIGATTPRAEMYGGSSGAGGWTPSATAKTVQPIAFISDSAGSNTVSLHIEATDWSDMVANTNRAWTHFRVWRTRRLTNNADPSQAIPGNLSEWFLCREYARTDVAFQRDVNGIIQGNDIISGTATGTTFTWTELVAGDSQEVLGADAPTNVTDPYIGLRSLPDVWDCCVANNLLHSIHRYSSELRDGDAVTAVPFSGYYAFRWNPADYDRVSSATQGDLTAIEEYQGDVYALKANSTHVRPLGDRDLPYRLINDMVGVARFDKISATPLGLLGVCTDDTLRLLRDGAWVERLAAASLSSGIPTDTHDQTTEARTWFAHNSSQIVIRTSRVFTGPPIVNEHHWHHTQFGGMSESDVAGLLVGVTSASQSKGCMWWDGTKAYRKKTVPSSDTTTDSSAESGVAWGMTTALLGNRKEPRTYDFRYASVLLSGIATYGGNVLNVGGGANERLTIADSTEATTRLVSAGTMWETPMAGGNPLAIDPTWKNNEQREVRLYPTVLNSSNAVDFNRHRVYGSALALGFGGEGAIALHSIHAEVRVSEGSNFDATQRPGQTDWSDLSLPSGNIAALGIHDLETEPWTWS